jgi:aminopeptidase N
MPSSRPDNVFGSSRFAGAALVLLAAFAASGCGWIHRAPPEPIAPPWDSISPPPIPEWLEIEAPEPVEVGVPPRPGRYDVDMRVLHYDVELVVPPGNDRVSTRTVIHYMRDERGPHPVTLDLTGMSVEAVMWDGRPLDFEQNGDELHFLAPGRPGILDTLRVEVMARGSPTDGLIQRDNVHGEPATFADNWPNRARFWFPSVDHPSRKATVSFTVHAPAGREVVANGVLIGEPEPADPGRAGGIEGLVTWRWETGVPIPTYLMVVGVADMVVMDGGLAACGLAPASPREDGCIEVTAWAFPPDTAHARHVFRRSAEMIDLYASLFGPYPYEKLANIQSSTRFGGMENASAIFYSERAIAEGRDIEGTVAHEIVHQWFGNSVTPADWPHLWLSEGFASYFGPFFWERTEGLEAFRRRIDANRERYLDSDVTHRPVVDHRADNLFDLLNRNSYQKGSLVLHMLRWVMGEQSFFRGVRLYYGRHAGGNATTDDLRLAMEEAHGESLHWFFDQWLHRPGYPVYALEWRWDDATNEARVTIRQEQDLSWPTFRMPMEIEFQLEGGVHRVVQWVDGREFTRRFSLPGPPNEIRLDPDGWLLMRMSGEVAGGG